MRVTKDRLASYLFFGSFTLLVLTYGILIGRFQIFPYPFLALAFEELDELRAQARFGDRLPFGYSHARQPGRASILNTAEACPGINMVVRIKDGQQLAVTLMDLEGHTLHEWNVDWFDLWPDARHVPERRTPRSRPGTHIHGAVVLKNGNLVFNFDHLGLVCLDHEGKVVWRLPYQTHHSVHLHDDGNLWVSGQKEHTKWSERFPNRVPPFEEYTVLEVTPDGEIVGEWSVAELLEKNGLTGLLYLGGLHNESTQVAGDVLHLNDVEPFPETMREGFFTKGDVAVSLRNINTVFVFNRDTEKIKFVTTGQFVRQHDPDFVDGNTLSVFDNNPLSDKSLNPRSRIVAITAPDNTLKVVYQGTKEEPFFTNIMGKHQWLPNGNLLIAESEQGRAFEINPKGEIVWEYINYVDNNTVGFLEQIERLPEDYFDDVLNKNAEAARNR